jgi:hypothetical protein
VATGGSGPPAVTTGGPAGQRPPGPLPGFPVRRQLPLAAAFRPSRPAYGTGMGRFPRRPRPPHGRRGSLRESQTERMRLPLSRAPFPPGSARAGRLRFLRSRCSRSRRTCSWRSSSLVPPHTPCSWWVARAYCRHWRRTRQAAQTAFALATSPAPGPCAAIGKNSSGSASRQAADRHQSLRSSSSAVRWAGSWVTRTMRGPPNHSCPRVTGDSPLHIGNNTYADYLYGYRGTLAPRSERYIPTSHDSDTGCSRGPLILTERIHNQAGYRAYSEKRAAGPPSGPRFPAGAGQRAKSLAALSWQTARSQAVPRPARSRDSRASG